MAFSEPTPPARTGALNAIASGVVLAWGWPRRLIAFVTGAAGALAMPPVGFAPALIISMVAAVWLIDGAADRGESGRSRWSGIGAAFGAGWWWGFGYFVAGLWWLGAAFLVDADQFAWALPLGVVALPAALAFFPAFGFAIARMIWPAGALRPLALAFGLSLGEWLRAVAFTGFPWNEFGMTLGQHLVPAQFASLAGLHALTLLSVAIFAAPATLWGAPGTRWSRAPTALAALALVGLFGFGEWRLAQPIPPAVAGAKIRLMQPNISQGEDFAPEKGAEILGRYLALSDRATSPDHGGIADVTHLFWPESPFPFVLAREAGALARVADFLKGGAILATGAASISHDARETRYFNSIVLLDRSGLLPERYDKHHLVPFGEYLPLRVWWERLGVTQFVKAPGGFSPGAGTNLLHIPGLPDAIAMICYEAIFPNERGGAREGEAARAAWLVNLTDDAWFGLTAGPYQHFAQARLRSVELGLPMARIANTGISAVVDAFGRVVVSAPLGAEEVLDSVLPGALPPTPQSRWGSTPFAAAMLFLALVCAIARARR